MNKLASFFKSTRLWGLLGTGVVLYFLFFVVLGKIDMSWVMPDTDKMARNLIESWPQMPFFAVQKQPVTVSPGPTQSEVVYYTVPTRELTPHELARMGVTNAITHPAPPK